MVRFCSALMLLTALLLPWRLCAQTPLYAIAPITESPARPPLFAPPTLADDWFQPGVRPVTFEDAAPFVPPSCTVPAPSCTAPPQFDPFVNGEAGAACGGRFPRICNLGREVWQDERNFYSWDHLFRGAVTFGFGAVLANTSIDQQFQDAWQDGIGKNQGVHQFKIFGEGKYVIPICAATGLIGLAFEQYPAVDYVGEWGERSTRALLVGAAPMLFMQYATGGSRPGEESWGSRWHPFNDNNGVSGHSFVGSIPFLTAARLAERPLVKAGFLALSIMPGLSRVNDDDHYLSQMILGWSMGAFAVSAVNETETGQPWRVLPWIMPDGCGFGCEWRR